MKNDANGISAAKRLRFWLEAGALRTLTWLIPKFPRRGVLRLGRMLGWLVYHVATEQRRVALANLDVAFGDTKTSAQKKQIALVSTQNFVTTMLGLFWSPRLTRDSVNQFIEFEPESLRFAREVVGRSKGVIGITMHYGDWEMLGLGLGFYGLPMTVVQEATTNPAIGEILGQLRGASGNRVISNHRAAVKLIKSIRQNEIIGVLADQHIARREGGVWVNFFGLPVSNTPAVGWLALRTGAPIVIFAARPLPDGRRQIYCVAELPYDIQDESEAAAQAINQQCMELCEAAIRKEPELWLWSYKRWKSRPTRERGRFPYYSRTSRIDVPDATD